MIKTLKTAFIAVFLAGAFGFAAPAQASPRRSMTCCPAASAKAPARGRASCCRTQVPAPRLVAVNAAPAFRGPVARVAAAVAAPLVRFRLARREPDLAAGPPGRLVFAAAATRAPPLA